MTTSSPSSQPGPDALFAEPRLAACYDVFDGERDDLPHYRAILAEHGARSVVDVEEIHEAPDRPGREYVVIARAV